MIFHFLKDLFIELKKELVLSLYYNWNICLHNYEEYSERPRMVIDERCVCQYDIVLRCKRCKKKKTVKSDLMVGFKIIEDEKGN